MSYLELLYRCNAEHDGTAHDRNDEIKQEQSYIRPTPHHELNSTNFYNINSIPLQNTKDKGTCEIPCDLTELKYTPKYPIVQSYGLLFSPSLCTQQSNLC